MVNPIQSLGAFGLSRTSKLGRAGIFLLRSLRGIGRPPGKFASTLKHIHFIGSKSFFVIFFTGGFTGMVLGLQGHYTLSKFGSESMLGAAVALSLLRELGPVMSALMVIGRAGSAMCAEIGIMRIEEQIDALECMAIDPHAYMVTPRIIACLVALPLLTAMFDVIGLIGGYLVGIDLMGGNPGAYLSGIQNAVLWEDVRMGLFKSLLFSVLIIWICTYKGFVAGIDRGSFGPEDVGRATTDAVVYSSVAVLVSDYVVTSILM